jgi:hypothetical protein
MNRLIFLLGLLLLQFPAYSQTAPAPLFRDPVYDGAADPMVIWNHQEKSWWMLYTGRRANQDGADVAYCYGSRIGVASTADHGATWVFRGYLDLDFENGMNTFWAPDVIYYNGNYHMFVVYIQGAYNHWGGDAHIVHYTSPDMWNWTYKGPLTLTSNSVIDATLFQMKNGKFRIWFKDQTRGSVTMTAESEDLEHWVCNEKPAIGGDAHEGPNVFEFQGYYWMITDEWKGLRVYRSSDLEHWEKQGLILDTPSTRPEDTPQGAHADVQVVGDQAYIFYFTHPGRKFHTEGELDSDGVLPYSLRRSSIQVAELKVVNGMLSCNRDEPFKFYLPSLPLASKNE